MSDKGPTRPTREQVDADLARADVVHNGGTNEVRLIVHRLAAEVRALRAELDGAGICGDRSPSVLGCALSFCELRAGHVGWHEVKGGPQWSHTALADGEDVPALLAAAADVLDDLVPHSCAGGDLGRIAVALRLMPAAVRAAVAAALARSTGDPS